MGFFAHGSNEYATTIIRAKVGLGRMHSGSVSKMVARTRGFGAEMLWHKL
jgi:hypothetical protein